MQVTRQAFASSAVLTFALGLAACGNVSYVQEESPANMYKDYREQNSVAVVGIGDPISKQQMHANATLRITGQHDLEKVMDKVAGTYNVAVRWGDGVRKNRRAAILISDLTFDEARNYIEDVYSVQIIREGERRLLILPGVDEPRIEEFSPGVNVTLSQVIRGLANQCGYNVVVTENKDVLNGTRVTTSLKDVTCLDAFDAVLNPHGLSLTDEGEHFAIGGLPTRQWVLNLFEPQRSESQKISYSTESGSGGEDAGSLESGASAETTITEDRNLWEEIAKDLEALVEKSCENAERMSASASSGGGASLLPPPGAEGDGEGTEPEAQDSGTTQSSGSYECGYVRINPSVGLIQMRAPKTVLREADEIIRRVEDIASRRLLVEARILAVTRTRGLQQGSNISAGEDKGPNIFSGGFVPGNVNAESSVSGKLISLASGQDGAFFGVNGPSIDALVKLTESFGTTYQLMKPTMEVMDRQRATLIDGRNEKFFIIERETEQTDFGETETLTTEINTQFVGIQFSVAAQIADEGEPHTLSVQVPITDIERFVTVPDDSGSEVPIVTTRIIDQKVRLRDEEIKVIGGLTKTIAIDRESGLPLIRNAPMAGKLFNEEDISYEDVEFVVLLQVKRLY